MGEAFYDAGRRPGPERTPKAPEVIETLADAVAEGGLRHPLALPHDPEHAGLPAAGPLDGHARPARPRSPRTARAGSAPTRSSRPWSRRWACPRTWPPAGQAAEPGPAARLAAAQGPEPQEPQEGRRGRRPGGAPAAAKGQGKLVRLGGPRLLFNALFGVDPSIPNDDVLGHHPPGPLPDERPDDPQPDPGPAGDRARARS